MDMTMDVYEVNDLKELWETPLDMNETLRLASPEIDIDWMDLECDNGMDDHKNSGVILHDRLMTDALPGSFPIKTEHSYSLTSDGDSMPDSPSDGKIEDLDDNSCPITSYCDSNNNTLNSQKQKKFLQLLNNNGYGAGSMRTSYYSGSQPKSFSDMGSSSSSSMSDLDDITIVKEEPLSPHSSCPPSPNSSYNNPLPSISSINPDLMYDRKPSSLLRDQHLYTSQTCSTSRIKTEPHVSNFDLPPTPPSSSSSDEIKGDFSPEHSAAPMSPQVTTTSSSKKSQYNNAHSTRGYTNSTRQPIHTPLISSQPKGSTGDLVLTDEEKRTLLAEGYPIPQRLPLTKAEEKSLKKIRRKIKNKISAQESRRKKKEYMDQLERRLEKLLSENNNFRQTIKTLTEENCTIRQKFKTLVDENSNLMKELQQCLFRQVPKNQSVVISRNAKRLLRADVEDSSLE